MRKMVKINNIERLLHVSFYRDEDNRELIQGKYDKGGNGSFRQIAPENKLILRKYVLPKSTSSLHSQIPTIFELHLNLIPFLRDRLLARVHPKMTTSLMLCCILTNITCSKSAIETVEKGVKHV